LHEPVYNQVNEALFETHAGNHEQHGFLTRCGVDRKSKVHSDGGNGISFLQAISQENNNSVGEANAPLVADADGRKPEMPAVTGPQSEDKKDEAAANQSEVCAVPYYYYCARLRSSDMNVNRIS